MIDRSIRITAVLAMILKGASILFGQFAFPLLIYYSGFLGMNNMGDYSEGVMYYIIRTFIGGVFSLSLFLVFGILLIAASKSSNEKPGMEIAAIVMVAGVSPIIGLITQIFLTYFVSREMTGYALAANSSLSTVAAAFSIIGSAATTLLIISATISICRKKFVIPMEYDRGIGVNEEYTSSDMGGFY